MKTVYIGIGSNLGDRKDNILQAVEQMDAGGVHVVSLSSIIETEPQGGPPQNKYMNAVREAQTEFSPPDLLTFLQGIEKSLGRLRTVPDGPRTIDLDILLYDNIKTDHPDLKIPHPRMLQRAFVMDPLHEIAPQVARRVKDEDHKPYP